MAAIAAAAERAEAAWARRAKGGVLVAPRARGGTGEGGVDDTAHRPFGRPLLQRTSLPYVYTSACVYAACAYYTARLRRDARDGPDMRSAV